MPYWIGLGIPTIILLAVYGAIRAGWFGSRKERQLDANTSQYKNGAAA